MKIFGKDLSHEIAVIAEIGVNHEGDTKKAIELIHLAAKAGADAVKFQSYTPARFISANDPERLKRVTRFALDEAAHVKLAAEAKNVGIHFLSTPVTEDWVPFLASIGSAIKIASGDLVFEPVIRQAARTGLPIILSTGIGSVDEIDRAVSWIEEEVVGDQLADRLALMHCVSAYPTPIDQANISSVPFLADRYKLSVGYSNHVIGIQPCLTAVALGAPLLEVHFTDDKIDRTFRDHALSFDASDLEILIKEVKVVASCCGTYDKTPQPCEIDNLNSTRKGVVAARDLAAGEILTESDLMWARPASDFAAVDTNQLIGKKLLNRLGYGETIKRIDVEE